VRNAYSVELSGASLRKPRASAAWTASLESAEKRRGVRFRQLLPRSGSRDSKAAQIGIE
jgi:hypothetical protein